MNLSRTASIALRNALARRSALMAEVATIENEVNEVVAEAVTGKGYSFDDTNWSLDPNDQSVLIGLPK